MCLFYAPTIFWITPPVLRYLQCVVSDRSPRPCDQRTNPGLMAPESTALPLPPPDRSTCSWRTSSSWRRRFQLVEPEQGVWWWAWSSREVSPARPSRSRRQRRANRSDLCRRPLNREIIDQVSANCSHRSVHSAVWSPGPWSFVEDVDRLALWEHPPPDMASDSTGRMPWQGTASWCPWCRCGSTVLVWSKNAEKYWVYHKIIWNSTISH